MLTTVEIEDIEADGRRLGLGEAAYLVVMCECFLTCFACTEAVLLCKRDLTLAYSPGREGLALGTCSVLSCGARSFSDSRGIGAVSACSVDTVA